jgi:hypothetical protein
VSCRHSYFLNYHPDQTRNYYVGVLEVLNYRHGEDVVISFEAINERMKFFNIITSLAELTYTDEEKLLALLTLFDNIHRDYHNLIVTYANIYPIRWLTIRKQILRNLGLTVLLKHLKIEEEMIDVNFQFLNRRDTWKEPKVNMKAYEDELRQMMDEVPFLINDEDFENEHPDFAVNEQTYRGSIVEQLLAITSDAKKKRINLGLVAGILAESEIEKLSQSIVTYIDDIQNKVRHLDFFNIIVELNTWNVDIQYAGNTI